MRYSPTGSHFASGGFDGKVFLYDGASADLVGEIGSPAHKGGVYAVSKPLSASKLIMNTSSSSDQDYMCNLLMESHFSFVQVAWSPDGKQLLTASGDKTCKLWDVETRSVVSEFMMGTQVEDQQVSICYSFTYL